jgi:cell division septum initiation protein DivIVA
MESERQNGADRTGDGVPIAEQVSNDVRARVQAQSSRAADSVQHAADAARQTAENLRGQEAWMAGLIEQGADRLGELARSLRGKDPRTLLADVEDFARKQPILFAGAAMALGFALTRAATTAARTPGYGQGGIGHDH